MESLPENNQRTRYLSFEEEDRLFAKLIGERDYLKPLIMEAIYADHAAESFYADHAAESY